MPRAALPSGRKLLLLPAFAALVISGAWWWWQRPLPEPVSSDGRRLSEWIAALPANREGEAIRPYEIESFGPEAIPWLIHTVQFGRHPSKPHNPPPFAEFPNGLRRYLPGHLGGLRLAPGDERVAALYALWYFGPKAEPALPVMARILRGNDQDLAEVVVDVLHHMGPVSWPTVEEGLQHGTPDSRSELARCMPERLIVDGVPASDDELAHIADVLERTCRDPEGSVRIEAARSLIACHRSRKDATVFASAIPHLLQLLSDPDSSVQVMACNQLDDLGLEAAPAIPKLTGLITHQNASVRHSAVRALLVMGIHPEDAAPRLRAMLQDPDLACREIAADALKHFHFPPVEEKPGEAGPPAR